MDKWQIKNRDTVFESGVFTIDRLKCHHPRKRVSHDFHILKTQDWINVVALTEDGRFIMVRQHRLGTDDYTMETPAGLIERGEKPEEAARRELEEETGYSPGDLVLLKRLSANPAIMNNRIYYYLATGCRKAHRQKLDPAEDIEVLLYTREEIIELIQGNRIDHSIIITALSLYFLSPYNDARGGESYYGQATNGRANNFDK